MVIAINKFYCSKKKKKSVLLTTLKNENEEKVWYQYRNWVSEALARQIKYKCTDTAILDNKYTILI